MEFFQLFKAQNYGVCQDADVTGGNTNCTKPVLEIKYYVVSLICGS